MKLLAFFLVCASIAVGSWFVYTEIFTEEFVDADRVRFVVEPGDTANTLGARLTDEGIIRHKRLFTYFVRYAGVDTKIQTGTFEVTRPITLARVVASLGAPVVEEDEITILPGWDNGEIADYLSEKLGISRQDVLDIIGEPAQIFSTDTAPHSFSKEKISLLAYKPDTASYEGYLAPDTYRIYKKDSIAAVIEKLLAHRSDQITDDVLAKANQITEYNFHELLTLASIVEREVRSAEDRAMVADIFWKRLNIGMALQADSTVHYLVQKKGNVFTTAEDRSTDSPWNTYKYPGLPPGPISTPSLASIKAVLERTENNYWYFLTDMEGTVHYAKTLDEHNRNVQMYLR